ncbi:MAG: Ig-like domain-containing protein [Planctomycetota bacterium]
MTASITVPYTTPTPTPTATPTSTPTEECVDAENISASPSELKLNTKGSNKVTITVTGKNGCPVEGDSIKASVSNSSLVTVSPRNKTTDENGRAVFTITAKNKTGNAVVTFRDGSLSTQVNVTVEK